MRIEFIMFFGVIVNIFLAMTFPNALLPSDTASNLIGDDYYNYSTSNNGIFGSKQKSEVTSLVNTISDEEATNDLTQAQTTEVSFLDSISNFFDGLFDSLGKIAIYFSLLIPFSSVLFLLPGAIGFIFGGIYSIIVIIAIIRFIRG